MKTKNRRGEKKPSPVVGALLLPFKMLRAFFALLSRRWFRGIFFGLVLVAGTSVGIERLLVKNGLASGGDRETLIKIIPAAAAIYFTLFLGVAIVRRFSRMTIKKLDEMEGREFEYACAGILRANGFKRVKVTKSSGDFGVDIVAEKKRKKYAVQCKRYDKKLNNSAIQEVIGGLAVYGCTNGAVMTNSFFTEPARRLAEANGVELWDRDTLIAMLDKRGTRNAVNESVSDGTRLIDPEAVCIETVEDFFEKKNISVEVVNAELREDSSELLIEITPETGIRISDIKALTEELAEHGGWEYVSCLFPSPTAGAVGLEIPLPIEDDLEE